MDAWDMTVDPRDDLRFVLALAEEAASDGDTEREQEIVAALALLAPMLVPDPDAKARARDRLMMELAEQDDFGTGEGPSFSRIAS